MIYLSFFNPILLIPSSLKEFFTCFLYKQTAWSNIDLEKTPFVFQGLQLASANYLYAFTPRYLYPPIGNTTRQIIALFSGHDLNFDFPFPLAWYVQQIRRTFLLSCSVSKTKTECLSKYCPKKLAKFDSVKHNLGVKKANFVKTQHSFPVL